MRNAGSFEDKILKARRLVVESLRMLGDQGDWVICATYEDHAVIANHKGHLFKLGFSSPAKLEDLKESIDFDFWPKTAIKEHCRSVCDRVLKGSLDVESVVRLSRNIDMVVSQSKWTGFSDRLQKSLRESFWVKFFENNEADIRGVAWVESKAIAGRRYEGVDLVHVHQWLLREQRRAKDSLALGKLSEDVRIAVADMFEWTDELRRELEDWVEGRGGVNKTSDIIPVLVEYVGRIELMNAYANRVSH